jgi:hypothetical protein
MNGQHTAGPWTITRGSHDGALYVIAGSDPSRAEVIAHRTTCPNWEANARLIAAAPDLLEALKALLRESVSESGVPLRPSRDTIAAAQAVVRKAVGA